MKLRVWESNESSREVDFDSNSITLGRDPSCDISFESSAHRKVSRVHARLVVVDNAVRLDPLSQSNKTLLNGKEIASATLLSKGDKVRLGFTGPEIEVIALTGSLAAAPPATIMSGFEDTALKNEPGRFKIGQGGIVGRDPNSAYLLDHPHVSRKHAKLQVATDGRVAIIDLASANGTFVNGERVVKSRILQPGDSIDIGPFVLSFDGKSLSSGSRANNIQLIAANVGCTVRDSNRKQLTLLKDILLVLNPGEFLCILGPSGSGKSTLLNIMSGRRTATSGSVLVNQRNLHQNFSALKQDLAVVPQTCVLHDTLTVQQSLRYTAELRLPPDAGPLELRSQVLANIQTIGLEQRRNVQIRRLSGGQLKRAGLGTELMAEPSLLFLDEVTSGLDEQSDSEMMQLFRSLADAGKTLVCITHNLANVERNCHLIAVLTAGGRLAFCGSPEDAKAYFGIARLADVYPALATRTAQEWATQFRSSKYYRCNIEERLPAVAGDSRSQASEAVTQAVSFIRQFWVLLRRTFFVWMGDKIAFATLGIQALLIAILLCLVFGDVPAENDPLRKSEIRNLLFLLCVSVIWLGCNNGVKEVVQERLIYGREKAFNLIPEAYFTSKLVFFSAIGALQTSFLSVMVLFWFSMPGQILWMTISLFAISFCGTCLGLAISANAKSEELAVALVPIVIIPQIVLAGVVASLSGLAEKIALMVIPVYWGQGLLESYLPEVDQISGGPQVDPGTSFLVIMSHALLLMLTSVVALRRFRVSS
ncbi:MAG: FHA domain-containing protein [Planctomycetales bacterium]|nr:FHA domain-containing protein [Planctomycetales bacterium]